MDDEFVELGKTYEDAVTGFVGVAISYHKYLQGCRRIGLERLDKDGRPDGHTFDEPNLIEMKKPNVLARTRGRGVTSRRTGDPHDHRAIPSRGRDA